jgi:putative restriction endonuclease
LPARVLPQSPELAFRFCSDRSAVAHRRTQRPDIRLPFFHQKSDGRWDALREDGGPAHAPRSAHFAAFATGSEAALRDPAFHREARRILIRSYFEPSEQWSLLALVGEPAANGQDGSEVARRDASTDEAEAARGKGRSARFRLDVVAG